MSKVICKLFSAIQCMVDYFRRGLNCRSRILDVETIKCLINEPANETDILVIVFSMDRAMQLEALLGSYIDNVKRKPILNILYNCSSMQHDEAYKDVFAEYAEYINPVKQESRASFKTQLLNIMRLSSARYVFFLVDDNLFTENIDLCEFAGLCTQVTIPTMRLGKNLSRSYTLQKKQKLPGFIKEYSNVLEHTNDHSKKLMFWLWKDGVYDWAYPISVDGHIFLRDEILIMSEATDFDSPNTYENNLQKFITFFSNRYGVCYSKSCLMNIPYNIVQSDYDNVHGEIHQEDMLAMWIDGYRIDRATYYSFVNESAHQELPINYRKSG